MSARGGLADAQAAATTAAACGVWWVAVRGVGVLTGRLATRDQPKGGRRKRGEVDAPLEGGVLQHRGRHDLPVDPPLLALGCTCGGGVGGRAPLAAGAPIEVVEEGGLLRTCTVLILYSQLDVTGRGFGGGNC